MDSIENANKSYFECFAFGDSPEMADELLALVLTGKKTATVSVVLEDESDTKCWRFFACTRWARRSSLCDKDGVS